MSNVAETTFYSVHKGHATGIYQTWQECEKQIKGYKRPIFKKFFSYEQAKYFKENGKAMDTVDIVKTKSKKSRKEIRAKNTTNLEPRIGELAVYTDGSSVSNGKQNCRAGYGIYFPMACHLNAAKPLGLGINGELPSNQRAELKAILEAIKIVNSSYPPDMGILIITDSKYSIQCVYPHEGKYKNMCQAWAVKWKQNKWVNSSGQPVKNRDIIEELFNLVQSRNLDLDKGRIRFIHVNSHCDIPGNEMADELAKDGRSK